MNRRTHTPAPGDPPAEGQYCSRSNLAAGDRKATSLGTEPYTNATPAVSNGAKTGNRYTTTESKEATVSTEPSESRVRDMYANATAWDFSARDERPDLVRLRSNAYAEFDRFIAKVKADALREAADELECREHCYNDAMSAAYVAGETGRRGVIVAYEAILEEPYGWLRDRAKEIEGEV